MVMAVLATVSLAISHPFRIPPRANRGKAAAPAEPPVSRHFPLLARRKCIRFRHSVNRRLILAASAIFATVGHISRFSREPERNRGFS
jgi:hypothetical protein